MREILRSDELPAQWQKYPLSTQHEMAAGRRGLRGHAIWQVADEGERWLRGQFKSLDFHTAVNIEERSITLKVYRPRAEGIRPSEPIFEVTELAADFVSKVTATKIIMVS